MRDPSRVEHAFGRGEPFTVGVEEELFCVDPETLALDPVAARVLAGMRVEHGSAGHEAYAAQVELRSPPCRTAGEAAAALAALRAEARRAGGTLLGAGLHPTSELADVALVDEERYRRVEAEMRGLIRRAPEAALHVHVGMPDAESCIRAYNGMRAHLPLLVGLSASSPWWFARDSGFASARWPLVMAYPGRGVPPALRDLDEYERAVAEAGRAGGFADYTWLWWDVRPHPRLGTLELREMDAQSSIEDVAAIAALVQALARAEVEQPTEAGRSDALQWSSFRAARDGVEAEVVRAGRLVPLREAARAELERVRPFARELGSEEALDGVERLLARGGGAGLQRAAHARGGIGELLEWLVEETGGRARSPA
jgi:glutamate---cysteine ligase / carboxylate-amine ligase